MADRPNRPNRPIRPRQGPPAGRRKRRVVIDTGAARPRQDSRQARDRAEARPKQPREVVHPTGPVTVESGVTGKDLSQALGKPMPEIIKMLMVLGAPKTISILMISGIGLPSAWERSLTVTPDSTVTGPVGWTTSRGCFGRASARSRAWRLSWRGRAAPVSITTRRLRRPAGGP